MKILITGDKGFVGKATRELLESMNHEVIGYDIMDGFDIRDGKQFEAMVAANRPDRILHLAAIARFQEADANPLLANTTNVLGTKNVADVAGRYHIPIVYASTGSALMPLNDFEAPYEESIPARGNSVYGCTKAIGEYYVRMVTPHIILRYAHLYGPEKRMHGLIGGYLDRINYGMQPVLMGGRQSNDFLYILDVARANMLALTADWDKYNQVYHIGTGEEMTAEEAGNLVCKLAGYKGKVEKRSARTVDPSRFVFNVKKAELMLKFKAQYKLKDGLTHMFKELGIIDDKK